MVDIIKRRARDKKRYANPEWKRKKLAYLKAHRQTPRGKYLSYIKGAKERKLKFELTFENYLFITSQPCYYCGAQEKIGIDRMNNSIGYILSNSTSCCPTCNYMKKAINKDQFIAHCQKIIKRYTPRLSIYNL